jgi:hypothetical protein
MLDLQNSLRGFLQQLDHQPVSRGDRGKADLLGYVRIHKLLDSLLIGQIHPCQFPAIDGPHLGLEAATKLPRYCQSAERFFHRIGPAQLEADSHHCAHDGAAHGPGVAYPAGEVEGDSRNRIVPRLHLEFLAHGQEYRFRSNVTLLHELGSLILLHDPHLFSVWALTSPPVVMRDRLCRGPGGQAV